ncbi:MAG TPA: hypothetical protein VJ873_13700, partial [bacterium]|nr:hypothetical protein [bacterium]
MKRFFVTAVLGLGFVMSLSPLGAETSKLNWMVNGDFTGTGGWSGGIGTQPGRDGKPAAYLENRRIVWSECDQKVSLPQPLPPTVEISGWLKIENVVKGANDWEMARITVVFYDAQGNRLGDWPAPIAEIQGTHDWDFYSNQYNPPKGTAYAMVGISLGNCTGKAWFSDIRFLAYDYDLKPLTPGQAAHPDRKPVVSQKTDNWLLNPDFETPSAGDWSQARVAGPGHNSLHCLAFTNDQPAWTLSGQGVSFKDKAPAFVVYSGWVKARDVVPGGHDWETARMGIDFRDANNKQVGGWQDSVCKVIGTTDWTYYEKKYTVPSGATQAFVDCGLGNCTGRAW